jgi:hypothetical protein
VTLCKFAWRAHIDEWGGLRQIFVYGDVLNHDVKVVDFFETLDKVEDKVKVEVKFEVTVLGKVVKS